uniref:integrase zinc binding domain-containing protein n=1 Tax=Bradyrhizobium sp. 33ap4 TaxID=3061630 RepID=UPI0029302639
HFQFEVVHRPSIHLTDADAPSRLLNMYSPEAVRSNYLELWEGTEDLQQVGEKFFIPETLVPKILHLYHDSAGSGGHDGFWRTYHKIRQRFSWSHMKNGIREYVSSCPKCQVNKAKYRPPTDRMTMTKHFAISFETSFRLPGAQKEV